MSVKVQKIYELLKDVMAKYLVNQYDVSDKLNMITAPKIYRSCKGKPILLVAERNDKNRLCFCNKTANESEDILVVYKNEFRCFNYDTELELAIAEIEKIVINQSSV